MTTGTLSPSWQVAAERLGDASARREATLGWLLRIACALCFIGHGAWGVITKAGWLPFYAVFGIEGLVAWKTMPIVGAVDIALGVIALVFPSRALFAYLTFWALFTALLRPLAGMGWWEFLERGGNYGPPLALLVIAGAQGQRWFARFELKPVSADVLRRVDWVLRVSIAFLLIGHGGFALFQEKKVLIDHWHSIGVAADATFLHGLGAVEIAAGIAVVLRPAPALLVAIAIWKIGNELLYPIAGNLRDGWEWVERGGDYVAPFALITIVWLLANANAKVAGRA